MLPTLGLPTPKSARIRVALKRQTLGSSAGVRAEPARSSTAGRELVGEAVACEGTSYARAATRRDDCETNSNNDASIVASCLEGCSNGPEGTKRHICSTTKFRVESVEYGSTH